MHRSGDGGARLAKPMDEPTQLPLGEARQDTERSPRLTSEYIATAAEPAIGAHVSGLENLLVQPGRAIRPSRWHH